MDDQQQPQQRPSTNDQQSHTAEGAQQRTHAEQTPVTPVNQQRVDASDNQQQHVRVQQTPVNTAEDGQQPVRAAKAATRPSGSQQQRTGAPKKSAKKPASQQQRTGAPKKKASQKQNPALKGAAPKKKKKQGATRTGSPLSQQVKISDHGTNKSLFGGAGGGNTLTRTTLIAAVAALMVAAIAWFATGGFGLNDAPDTPPETPTTSTSQQAAEPTNTIDQQVEDTVAKLTLEQKIAQMFIVTPEGLTGADAVLAAGDVTRLAIHDRPVGGLIYFEGNLQDPTQTREMLATTQQFSRDACGLPMFLCVDEEGGEVTRVASNPAFEVENVEAGATIGATGDTAQATQAARTIANYLANLGFNVDFAPVADIASSEDSAMYGRAFGSTAEEVTPMVEAQVKGFAEGGVLCAVKHFPGIGAAIGDSHYAAITTERTLGEMQNEEFKPFQAAIAANVPMVMVGHIGTNAATGSSEPASLSKEVITDILRGQLGYDGIVVTDSLQMGAISDSYDAAEVGVKAIQAGADIILMPSNFESTFRGVMDAVNSGVISEERINESVRRIVKAKLTMKDNTPTAAAAAAGAGAAAAAGASQSGATSSEQANANATSSEASTDSANAFEAAIAAGESNQVAGSDAGDVPEESNVVYEDTSYEEDTTGTYDETYDASYEEYSDTDNSGNTEEG